MQDKKLLEKGERSSHEDKGKGEIFYKEEVRSVRYLEIPGCLGRRQ